MTPRSITILGKSGSGKDTQVEILAKKITPNIVVSTGDHFRAMEKLDTVAGRKVKKILEEGGFMPAWLAAYTWQDEFVQTLKGDEHLLFKSNPRRLEEAQELDEVIKWLGRSPVEAVLLDISDEEAMKRMLKRDRDEYDTEENIKERLAWFRREVTPVIEHYEHSGRLHRIDGVGPIDEIAERIVQALRL